MKNEGKQEKKETQEHKNNKQDNIRRAKKNYTMVTRPT